MAPPPAEQGAGDSDVVTRHAEIEVSSESFFTKEKGLLYLVLAVVFFAWLDLFGIWILPLWVYFVALTCPYPRTNERMQARAVVILEVMLVSLPVCLVWFFIRGGRIGFAFLAVYVAWYTLVDDAAESGGRFYKVLRQRAFWRHFGSYFPMSLTRTAKLDPNRNYLFGYHPHGIISLGAICNFATEATGFSELFPGIDLRVLTLTMNFRVPIFREYLLGMGINDASRRSCERNLSRGRGTSIMLVVGGARESLSTTPGQADLFLKNRKGFVKVALRQGASLVPVFSFGENDLFGVAHNGLEKLQLAMQKKMGFAIPLFFGRSLSRGLFRKVFGAYGPMPLRVPVCSVVGNPIHCEKVEHPTQTQVDEKHAEYVKELERIFNKYHKQWEVQRAASLGKEGSRKLATDLLGQTCEKTEDGRYHLTDIHDLALE